MDKNEIKKALYKERPVATAIGNKISNGKVSHKIYNCESSVGVHEFYVPTSESTEMNTQVPAQLLIRWLV